MVMSVKGTLTLWTSAGAGSSSSSSVSLPVGPLKAPEGTSIGLKDGKSAVGKSKLGRGKGIGSGMIGPGRFIVGGISWLANLLIGQGW